MLKALSLLTLLAFTMISFGCGGGAPANSNSNTSAAGTGNVKVDAANLPPGFSTQPIQPSANATPGIPAVNTVLPKGGTPTPGIPSPEELKKGIKPGVTPTPGIPSPVELKKAMSGQPSAANAPPPISTDAPMMKSTNKIRKPQ